MAGVILETLSNRKLIGFGILLLVAQIIALIVGGCVAPSPYYPQHHIATMCLDIGNHVHKSKFFVPWGPEGERRCDSVEKLSDPIINQEGITANQVVFAVRFPLPRDMQYLDMSRWFQNIVGVLVAEVHYTSLKPQVEEAVMTLDVGIAYRDKWQPADNWTEITRSTEVRKLKCQIMKEEDGYPLECDPMPLFELASCHHDYYLLNIRLPIHEDPDVNMDIGALQNINVISIHQNGGFTKVWFSLKTFFFPVIIAALCFYWRRVAEQVRPANLLEKTLLGLGCVLTFLNLPVEWFTLWVHMPYMLLYADIRQGLFYSALLCFWIIFAGEHLMDSVERNRLVMYWRQLSAVAFGCICLFVFDVCERGVQISNPFYTIWATETGTNMAYTFVILAGISACLYFVFLCFLLYKVMRNINAKKSSLPDMSKVRRKYYMGLIYRFRFLIMCTLVCAALTVIFFIVGQVGESTWKWFGDGKQVQYTSAFLTGVYAMWNLYVLALLILYSPSHKYISAMAEEDDANEDEEIEFSQVAASEMSASLSTVTAETSALAAFAKKAAAD